MKKVHNFNAGPCVLPKEAVEATIEAIRNFDNTGIGLRFHHPCQSAGPAASRLPVQRLGKEVPGREGQPHLPRNDGAECRQRHLH